MLMVLGRDSCRHGMLPDLSVQFPVHVICGLPQ
jgi:hypothetical protein